MHRDLGSALIELCREAETELVLIAPFVKLDALKRLLAVLSPSVKMYCVVRWRPDDIAAGVSDLAIFQSLTDRGNSRLQLHNALHAKFFRSESRGFVGSANLTLAALGWSYSPNLELMVPITRLDDFDSFERKLLDEAIDVDQQIVDALEAYVAAMPPILASAEAPNCGVPDLAALQEGWLPSMRSPELLYSVYVGDRDQVSRGAYESGQRDLAALGVPEGLTPLAFKCFVQLTLWQLEWVKNVAKYVLKPRRFGEMSNWLKCSYGIEQPKNVWQTLVRWLLYFLPDRFACGERPYTEVFYRVDIGGIDR